jgi:hypothetical protein
MATKQVANTYKFAVEKDGQLFEGAAATELLLQPLWPDKPFMDVIPVMESLPGKTLSPWKAYPDIQPEPSDEVLDCSLLGSNRICFLPFDPMWWGLVNVTSWRHHLEVGAINPLWAEAKYRNDQKMAAYLEHFKMQYPTVRLVLMGAQSVRMPWFVIEDPNHSQWAGFIRRTILMSKEYTLQQMVI